MDNIKETLTNADPFQSWWPFIMAGVVFIVTIIRAFMGGQQCPSTNNINGQVVIVTGASGGIGVEVCKELSARNGTIVMACRDMEKAEAAKKQVLKSNPRAQVEVRYLDLRSFDNVKRFVKGIESEYEQIDILINNAGLTFHPFERTADKLETHLQVNYLGHLLLTQLMLPMLKKSFQGRIINVSAHAYAAGKITEEDPLNIGTWAPAFHARDAFSHSKLCIVLATRHLAKELKGTAVTVNSCTPGLVRGTEHLRKSPIMKALCAKVITYPWMYMLMKTPQQGAQTIIYLATEPKLKDVSGEFFNDCDVSALNETANDDKLAEKLYTTSMKILPL